MDRRVKATRLDHDFLIKKEIKLSSYCRAVFHIFEVCFCQILCETDQLSRHKECDASKRGAIRAQVISNNMLHKDFQHTAIADRASESRPNNEANGHLHPLDGHSSVLREQIEARSEALDDTQTANMVIESIPAAEISAAQANGTRFLHAVKRIGRLQQHTINAQIDARQKRREIGFKRRDVWDCDANFMKELQSLVGQEKLEGFPSLSKLAEKCQIARDGLGPLEEEGSMAEMRLEGKFWKLQQAEKSVFTEFENTFGSEDSYATEPSSSSTSIYDPPFDEHGQSLREEDKDEVAIIPRSLPSSSNFEPTLPGPGLSASLDRDDIYQDSMLLGLNDNTAKLSEGENIYLEYSDSGIGDIDNPPDVRTTGSTAGHFHPLPGRPQASVEPYPHLVTDFGSRRDRINKWLEHMMLVSPLESSTLFGVLQNQLNPKMPIPSNWSQLVIAYWELDGATTPNIRPSPRPEILPVHSNHESQKHLHERLYATGNQTHSVKIAPANPHPESL